MPLTSDKFDEEDCKEWIKGKEKMWEEHGYGPWTFVVDDKLAGWGGCSLRQVMQISDWSASRFLGLWEDNLRRDHPSCLQRNRTGIGHNPLPAHADLHEGDSAPWLHAGWRSGNRGRTVSPLQVVCQKAGREVSLIETDTASLGYRAALPAIRLVDSAEPYYLTGLGISLDMQLGMIFLVYAFVGSLLKPQK